MASDQSETFPMDVLLHSPPASHEVPLSPHHCADDKRKAYQHTTDQTKTEEKKHEESSESKGKEEPSSHDSGKPPEGTPDLSHVHETKDPQKEEKRFETFSCSEEEEAGFE